MTTHNFLITPVELNQLLNGDISSIAIFDCRFDLTNSQKGRDLYAQGHIPSAVYVDLEKDLSGKKNPLLGRHPLPTPSEWASTISKLGISASTLVILYDQMENTYSARMWWMLKAVGLNKVRILDGGYSNWQNFGGSISTTIEAPKSLPNQPSVVQFNGLIRMADVQENIKEPRFTILDARATERFKGEVEPLDPIAGHIPGALNRPYKQNLNSQNIFKSPSELKEELSSLLFKSQATVHQCGSGVTACHNLLAMEIAGIRGSLLYAGSWSEWCNHTENPVAVGI